MNTIIQFINCSEELIDLTGQVFKPCVVVLGSYNSGKSTLLNHLLGENISPVDIIPTTSCLLHFDYGNFFKAGYSGPGGKKDFSRREELHSFLLQKRAAGGRVDILIPSPILRKCRLVDTPGVDYLNNDAIHAIEQSIVLADKVIYLFHQRGIEEHNRLFLYKLASAWKNKSQSDISFWLNCNLGKCDGTSLETTRSALREIFLSQARLNTINTLKHENVEVMRLFLEVELARETFKEASKIIKKIDGEFPKRISAVTGIQDECRFLSEFWEVHEMSQKILHAGGILHTLPSVLRELDNSIELMNRNNLRPGIKEITGKPYRPKLTGIKEISASLLNLIFNLKKREQIQGFINQSQLTELYDQIKENRFSVVLTGGFSTGKSTFLNAILKEEILPTADGPSTSSVFTITYGHRKTATVRKPLQVILHFYDILGDKAVLRREEISTLQRWLSKPDTDIAYLEAWSDSGFRRVKEPEIANRVDSIKELFAAGAFLKSSNGSKIQAFKPIPAKRIKRHGLLPKVRVTFNYPEEQVFDLSKPPDVAGFKKAIGPDNTLRIDLVKIEHPCELLIAYDFIDTPGLDWIKRHYSEQLYNYIRQKDAYLVFFNAKHILSNMINAGERKLFEPPAEGDIWWEDAFFKKKEKEKFYFVINFADVITPSQQEAVCNFVRESLSRAVKSGEYIAKRPKISLISSLRGYAGENGGIADLLRNLEEGIIKSRGKEFFQTKADALYFILDSASRKVNDEILSRQLSYEIKRNLSETQDILRESKRRLKEIRNAIYSYGRC